MPTQIDSPQSAINNDQAVVHSVRNIIPTLSLGPTRILEVPLANIKPGRNPRKRFEETALNELAASIKTHGLLEPVICRYDLDKPDHYELIAGERRWRASQLAGCQTILVRAIAVTEDIALELALVENLQRQDLDAVEEAQGYRALMDLGYKQTEIAEKVNRSQPTIANRLRLLDLPGEVLDGVSAGNISPSNAEVLASMKDVPPAAVAFIGQLAVEHRITLAKLEKHELPYQADQAIRDSKLGKDLNRAKFSWKTECSPCPFKARWDAGTYAGWCMKPDHYRELQSAAVAAEKEELAVQARAKGIDLPEDAKIPPYNYNTMCELRDVPAGCTKECACRGIAVDPYNKSVIKNVCTNRTRFTSLQEADKAKKLATRREQAKRDLDIALHALEVAAPQISLSGSKAVARLAALSVSRLYLDKFEDVLKKYKVWDKRTDPVQMFNSVPPEKIMPLAFELQLHYEYSQRCDHWQGDQAKYETTKWLMQNAKGEGKKAKVEKAAVIQPTTPNLQPSAPSQPVSIPTQLVSVTPGFRLQSRKISDWTYTVKGPATNGQWVVTRDGSETPYTVTLEELWARFEEYKAPAEQPTNPQSAIPTPQLTNPFDGWNDTNSRLDRVKDFDLAQLQAALQVKGLQGRVRFAAEKRIKKLEAAA